MIVCSPIKACVKNVCHLSGHFQRQMRSHLCNITSPTPSGSCCVILKQNNSRTRYSRISVPGTSLCLSDCGTPRSFHPIQYKWVVSNKRGTFPLLTVKSSACRKGSQEILIDCSAEYQNAIVRVVMPKRGLLSNFKCNGGSSSSSKGSGASGLISGLFVCYSTSDSVHAEAPEFKGDKEECTDDRSSGQFSHGKKVHTDYSVIGIPGDGRCLFRSVAHGACLRSGRPAPSESQQKELADELRARVADEFIRRRQETEWFIEGDFDTYVSQIRKPHVWGGEPELLMLSHVLRMPITVYMHDEKNGGLISIAEYGQEYGKDNPIRVLYHGFGHYDALLFPGKKGAKSRL